MNQSTDIDLLYVDEAIVVANKPSGLSVHRGWDRSPDVAMFRVRDRLGERVYPIHRLDRGASGALLFARREELLPRLALEFQEQRVHKEYLALVRGRAPKEGIVDHPIPRSEGGLRAPAYSTFVCLAHSPIDRCSLVRVRPTTGRLHQVRRHMKHVNHPLIGDANYGSGALNRHYRSVYGLARLALHAELLSFRHPVSGEPMTIHASLPSDLVDPWHELGLMDRLASESAPS